jgi:hypothetical protein
VAWAWAKDDDRYLIIVNLSGNNVQARVQTPWHDSAGQSWRLIDALSGATYDRDADEMLSPGLYVELGPWNFNLFQCGHLQSRKSKDVAELNLVSTEVSNR